MHKPQFSGVQRHPGCPAVVGDSRPGKPPPVHLVATQRVPRLGEMNANLVRPSRLQPTLDHGVARQVLDWPHMRGRNLAQLRIRGAPPPTIPPVIDQSSLDGLRFDMPEGHRDIQAVQCMVAKLQPQQPLGIDRAGKHHQATGFAIQPMDRPHPSSGRQIGPSPAPCSLGTTGRSAPAWRPGAGPSLPAGDRPGQNLVERRLQLLPLLGPRPFLGVPQRGHPGGLFDNHEVRVEVANPHILFRRGGGRGIRQQPHDVTHLQSPSLVETEIAIHLQTPPTQQAAQLIPRQFGLSAPQQGQQRHPGLLRSDVPYKCCRFRHGAILPAGSTGVMCWQSRG